MDSKKYYNAVNIKMQEKNYIGSNYTKKVGRELNIFSSDKGKKDYIESKSARIFEDYEYKEKIKWNNDSKGIVKISKKGVISFPKSDIINHKKFLTHIPYGLMLRFHYLSNQQSLCKIPFEYWVDYFSRSFFKIPYYSKPKLVKVCDTLFVGLIFEELEKANIKKEDLQSEENEVGRYHYYEGKVKRFFYMKQGQRHLLYQIFE